MASLRTSRAKPKPIFRHLVIAGVGDLNNRQGGTEQWTDANIARSIEIVTLDWLEDSMFRDKRLPTELYSHRRALERERQKERMRLRYEKGIERGVKEVNPNLYHLYRDDTFFQYEVTITRDDETLGIPGERYVLSIWESNNPSPHMYWFVAKFYKKKGDPQPKIHRPSIAAGMLCRELALFESFFHLKTGIPWMQRLVKAGTTPRSYFQYRPPAGGKPVGYVPPEFMPAGSPDPSVQLAIAAASAATAHATHAAAGIASAAGVQHVSNDALGEDGPNEPDRPDEDAAPQARR
ncbi:hypothetical protein VTJ83DRAFT_1251 [Remersonia thermophila]|uniref:BRCT domain-containing protein n=1 Tax=Remersonia thermophila TaxID=72144 RepID=A0ABR4DNG7_9PEZI